MEEGSPSVPNRALKKANGAKSPGPKLIAWFHECFWYLEDSERIHLLRATFSRIHVVDRLMAWAILPEWHPQITQIYADSTTTEHTDLHGYRMREFVAIGVHPWVKRKLCKDQAESGGL
jgi:hypothetical protein